MFTVYVLYSDKYNKHYVGYTSDLEIGSQIPHLHCYFLVLPFSMRKFKVVEFWATKTGEVEV